jgi:hypothetical protein
LSCLLIACLEFWGAYSKINHVKWVPCHHGMARPQVADGGESLQIWRVAANILNNQSRTADKGCPPAWGLGRGLTTLHRKERNTLRNVTKDGSYRWRALVNMVMNLRVP